MSLLAKLHEQLFFSSSLCSFYVSLQHIVFITIQQPFVGVTSYQLGGFAVWLQIPVESLIPFPTWRQLPQHLSGMEFFYTPSFFSPQLFLSRLLITNFLMSIYNVVPSEAQLWPHDLLTVRLSDRTVAEKLLDHSTRPLNIQDGHRIWLGKQDGTLMVQIGGSPPRELLEG